MKYLNKLLPLLLMALLVACTSSPAPETTVDDEQDTISASAVEVDINSSQNSSNTTEVKLDCVGVAPLDPTLERCKSVSNLATFVMTERQNSTPITSVIDTLVKDKKHDELTEYIVFEAYNRPSYSIDELQKSEILEFGNRIYMECIQSIREYEESNENQ